MDNVTTEGLELKEKTFMLTMFSNPTNEIAIVLPFCRSAVLPFCRSAVLPFCRSAVLPFCRSAVLPFCRLLDPSPFIGGGVRPTTTLVAIREGNGGDKRREL